MHTLDIAPLRSESPPQKCSGMARVLKGFHSFTCTFIRNWNEPYLPLPSQPQLVLIYRPRRDGRLSRPWCEVAQAEIRTRNLRQPPNCKSGTLPHSHQRTVNRNHCLRLVHPMSFIHHTRLNDLFTYLFRPNIKIVR